jgi:hypothetical protein
LRPRRGELAGSSEQSGSDRRSTPRFLSPKLVRKHVWKLPRKLGLKLVQELIWQLTSNLISSHSALLGPNLSLNLNLNLSLSHGLNLGFFLALNLSLNLNHFLILNPNLNLARILVLDLPPGSPSFTHSPAESWLRTARLLHIDRGTLRWKPLLVLHTRPADSTMLYTEQPGRKTTQVTKWYVVSR